MKFPEYPDNSNYVYVNGKRMHYLEGGKGNAEKIIMLHGNPTWSFYYRRLFNELIDKYHCILPDHIGMGLSEKPSASEYNFTLEQRFKDIEFLLDYLSVGNNLTLIVHDWGGMIGLVYTAHHPDKIKRLVISNTSGFHIPKGKKLPWELRVSRIPYLGNLLIQGLNLFCLGAVNKCVTKEPMKKEIRDAYLFPYTTWKDRLAVFNFVKDIPINEKHISYALVNKVDNSFEKISKLPVMILWGTEDFVFDHYFLDEWKHRLPNAKVYEYKAGHYLLEEESEDIIAKIKNFLNAN